MLIPALVAIALASAAPQDAAETAAARRAAADEVVRELAARDYEGIARRFVVERGGPGRPALARALAEAANAFGAPAERPRTGLGEGRAVRISGVPRALGTLEWRAEPCTPVVVWVTFERAGPGFIWVFLPNRSESGDLPLLGVYLVVVRDSRFTFKVDALEARVGALLTRD